MGEVVNLRAARKLARRKAAEKQAAENRLVFGRSRSERSLSEKVSERNRRTLDAHRRDEGDEK